MWWDDGEVVNLPRILIRKKTPPFVGPAPELLVNAPEIDQTAIVTRNDLNVRLKPIEFDKYNRVHMPIFHDSVNLLMYVPNDDSSAVVTGDDFTSRVVNIDADDFALVLRGKGEDCKEVLVVIE
jgi:hypothetical protein